MKKMVTSTENEPSDRKLGFIGRLNKVISNLRGKFLVLRRDSIPRMHDEQEIQNWTKSFLETDFI